MKKTTLLFIQVLLPALLLAAPEGDVTGEQSLDPRIMAADTASAGSVLKTAWLKGRDDDAAKEADRLIESIRAADRDTLDLPEAGFTVTEPNPELKKLLNRGSQNLNDLEYLLADLKNGFFRQRIIEALSAAAPEAAAGTFRQALKDRSSGVRLSALKALMETADGGASQYFTPLLYDRYAQRRDYYPVRAAARDAIEFLKLKTELKDQPGSVRAQKYCEALKEKAGKKQFYFCELCGKELVTLPDGAEALYAAYLELKSPAAQTAGSAATLLVQTGAENASFYMLTALAVLKDVRVKGELLALLADKNNMLPGFRALMSLDPVEALKLYCPLDLLPAELLGLLSGVPGRESCALNAEHFSDEAFRGQLTKRIMRQRKFSAYVDAARYYYELGFDREKALGWLASYDPSVSGMEQPYNRDYGSLKALCLLPEGKAEEAALLDPYAPGILFKKYAPEINILKSVPAESPGFRIAAEALYKIYLKLGLLPCALQQLSALSASAGIKEEEREIYKAESARLNGLQAEKLGTLFDSPDTGTQGQVLLAAPATALIFKPGEDIKITVSIKNDSPEQAYLLNSAGGPLGFDAGLFYEGLIAGRLFADETEKLSAAEAAQRVEVLAPGVSFEKEYVLLPAAQNTVEKEYDLIITYDGGAPLKGFEKGWTGKLISETLKVAVKK